MKKFQLRSALGVLLLAFMCVTAIAQTSRGTLTGIITDTTNAVVVNADVKLTEIATGVSRQTNTNAAGLYRFDAVDLGTYTISVQAKGFASQSEKGIEVQAARTLNLDITLKVGSSAETVTVEANAGQIQLDTSEQTRGGHFETQTIADLPITGRDSLTLALLVPGVTKSTGNSINQDGTFSFAVNGQRPRGNNFMIDGVENNDISVTGPAFVITNPDAVNEVAIQTADFSSEFGRAGGAVINQVTKSGSNALHGTAVWVYTGSAFKALDHNDAINHKFDPPRQVENVPYFSLGGPVVIPHLYDGHSKTFFFGAAQWDRLFGQTTAQLRLPDAAGVAVLQSLAGSCPNAALYLQALGALRGDPTASPAGISLAVPSAAGTCNGSTRTGLPPLSTGLALRAAPFSSLDNNHQVRVDHVASDKQTLSFRWLYDSSITGPSLNNLPGFDNNFVGRTMNALFSDTYMITPSITNEFRFNYGRIGFNFPLAASDAFHTTLANYSGLGVTGFGGATNIPQFRFANNWGYQDTMTLVRGKHTFRFGADFLRQLARQHPPFNERGSFAYAASAGPVTAFANFLDDFGGTSGALNRQFGSSIYYPNLFRQSYFGQDSWKTTSNLTLNIGLRYEYYGAPENAFAVAAFTGYDPVNFAAPHKVPGYKKNFAPSVGFAWNPKGSNWFSHIMGGEKSVWRGGFQTSYDSAFNNLLSNIAGSSPNTLGGTITSPSTGRGFANFSGLFSGIQATPATAQSPQNNLFLGEFPNPQTNRWSLGFERELPYGFFWDTSYVGSISDHLYRTIDMNPFVAPGVRFQPQVGARTVRAASANSNYESLQVELKRRFKNTPLGAVLLRGSYTYSHFLDDVSDVFGFASTPSSFQSVSQVLGASPHIDYGSSDFDRRHVGSIGFSLEIRAPKTGLMRQILGGWKLAGIADFQTGEPYTMSNGTDRNGDGQSGPDRPDISNPAAPLNTRAVRSTTCVTGYSNPDLNGACVDPNTVHWIEGIGLPNARTVGRNTLLTNGYNNLDLSIAKSFKISERSNFEYRVDMFNATNTINFIDVPSRIVNSNANVKPGQVSPFLNFQNDNSIGRSMQMRLKLTW
ncbi:MAG TPA: carboxypeptidase regulatory-like domain-containing protein [Candidatus Angelobacter sp.]|nr:carboxypeptidase regulatory-like domain-containing protein [Candidatus Angelobacter sp.]